MNAIKDTIIIGNGFDIWQGLDTRYVAFQQYYLKHRDEIVRKLRIPKKKIQWEDGDIQIISDVELIYGNPFNPAELEDDFWGTFENSLSDIDADNINFFFGKSSQELRKMLRSIKNAKRILTKAFCDWIRTIEVDKRKPEYKFGENCVLINFNYTDTISKRFEVFENSEFHIHGCAQNSKSIVFGHASHPEQPTKMLYRLGGRFRGLYNVEKLLYETDKHIEKRLEDLIIFLSLKGMRPEHIKHIYVLGHSMSNVDLEYFRFFANVTRSTEVLTKEKVQWHISCHSETDRLNVKQTLLQLDNEIEYEIYDTIENCLKNFRVVVDKNIN